MIRLLLCIFAIIFVVIIFTVEIIQEKVRKIKSKFRESCKDKTL